LIGGTVGVAAGAVVIGTRDLVRGVRDYGMKQGIKCGVDGVIYGAAGGCLMGMEKGSRLSNKAWQNTKEYLMDD
jgi:hypothetical protein